MRFVLALMLGLLTVPGTFGQDGWKLVWADEFDTDGPPDAKNWVFEKGVVRNRELQWYQPDNARCVNGMLVIEGRRERKANPGYRADARDWKNSREFIEYTSSSLETKGLHQWLYGRFEMKGRIDTRPGMWPAFWALGVTGRWPSNGEIDIMEYYRGMLLANAAWAGDQTRTQWSAVKKPLTDFKDPKWSEKFHVWRMDWDKDWLVLSVDDEVLNRVDLSKTINGDGSGKNPFHEPQYILLNLAIGGENGGDPSATAFPGRMEVDYVRVYQRQ